LVFEIEMLSWGHKPEDITKAKDKGIMKKKIIEAEESYSKPEFESTCTYHLKVSDKNGSVFHNTSYGGPLTTTIGEPGNTKALEKSMKSMAKGEKAEFHIQSKYAYGSKGSENPKVAPNTDLVYEIELISFEKKEERGLSFEEKKNVTLQRKAEGNEFFQQAHYRSAKQKYKQCLKTFEYERDLEGEKADTVQKDIRLPCHLNLAACYLKLNNTRKTLVQTKKALEIDAKNVKGLWRQGLAEQAEGNWDVAKKSFDAALAVDPGNASVVASLKKLKAEIAQFEKKQAAIYKSMFA